jgi:hypothetical protein
MTTPNIDLGKFGVFVLGGVFAGGAAPEQAQEIERLGYGTLWVSGSPPAELSEKRTPHQHVRHTTRNWRIN